VRADHADALRAIGNMEHMKGMSYQQDQDIQQFIDTYGPGAPLFEHEVDKIAECQRLGQ
jgi:hypothetical protein